MTTATEARAEYLAARTHTQTALEAEIEARGCPACGHDSYRVEEAYPATRTDPASWEGHCTCANSVTGDCDCSNCADGDVCAACCQCDED